jgi:hypothetical protein
MMNAQMGDLNLESTHELENGAPILHHLQQAIENGPWILAAVSFHHLFFIVSTPASPTHDSSVRAHPAPPPFPFSTQIRGCPKGWSSGRGGGPRGRWMRVIASPRLVAAASMTWLPRRAPWSGVRERRHAAGRRATESTPESSVRRRAQERRCVCERE